MVNVLLLFPKSTDPKEVDDILANRFIPAHKQALGLRTLKISEGDVMSPGGPRRMRRSWKLPSTRSTI